MQLMEVSLMPLLNIEELTFMKLMIIKDLEKTLKIGYEHQYRNILSKIVSNQKRFVKKSLPKDVSEDLYRYDALAAGLANYLINLFEVFGESAVLNAKKIFEENGSKWGKKLKKRLFIQDDIVDINYVIKNLYINIPELDYMDITNDDLVWHFSKQGNSSVNEGFGKFNSRFYAIKTAWLHSFTKSFTSQYASIFEKKSEDDNEIITSIALKENIE
ncbi:MAG TPA: hypothetical protein VEB00_03330 [Clostridia bacterium]|nr:hypothetical protein [Clostridia bacterium]